MEVGPAEFSACGDTICAVKGCVPLSKENSSLKGCPRQSVVSGVWYSQDMLELSLKPVCSHCCLVTP